MKIKWVSIILSIWLSPTAYAASYDSSSRVLEILAVQVENKVWFATLQQANDSNFVLRTLEQVGENTPIDANFSFITKLLQVSDIDVNGTRYDADLLFVGNNAFRLQTVALSTTGACANIISDDVVVDTTWQNTGADCDYLIVPRNADDPTAFGRAPVTVTNARLTIEPGVKIRFALDGSINIHDGGALHAVGTPAERIRFESAEPIRGYGRGLYFTGHSLASRVEYADLINLGEDISLTGHDAAIAGDRFSAGLTLKHSTVSGSSTSGAELYKLNIIEFENNAFFDNTQFGIVVSGRQMHKLDTASDYLGASGVNGRPFVSVIGVGSTSTVENDANWSALNAPYFIGNALHIDAGDIDIAPGTRFVFGEGARLRVDEFASLRAVGTASQPIIFTGEHAVRGYWDNIVFFESSSARNRFEYVEVSYGGRGTADASVEVLLRAFVTITQSTITNSNAWGVCVDQFSDATLNLNTYQNNLLGDVTFDC